MKNEFKVGDLVRGIEYNGHCEYYYTDSNMISGRIMDINSDGYLTIGEIKNPKHPVLIESKAYSGLDPKYFEKINDSSVCPPELENVFKKSDLQDGDVVTTRDGETDTIIKKDDGELDLEEWDLSLWNNDLIFANIGYDKNDIVQITRKQVFEINQDKKETLNIAEAEKLLASLGHNVVIKQ